MLRDLLSHQISLVGSTLPSAVSFLCSVLGQETGNRICSMTDTTAAQWTYNGVHRACCVILSVKMTETANGTPEWRPDANLDLCSTRWGGHWGCRGW